MLVALAIRDIVIIDRLSTEFSEGLTAFTGETGAGKSILLDALSLALGGRGDASLVREDCAQGDVTAVFDVASGHKARAILADSGIAAEGDLILRRVQGADGRSRAFVNDQPVSVVLLAPGWRGAGRDPRPACRPRHGRAGHAPGAARRLRRARGPAREGRRGACRLAPGRGVAGGPQAPHRIGPCRGRLSAFRGRRADGAGAAGGRGDGARRPPPADDACREDRRRHRRGA